jgi:type II secretory pathway component PulC
MENNSGKSLGISKEKNFKYQDGIKEFYKMFHDRVFQKIKDKNPEEIIGDIISVQVKEDEKQKIYEIKTKKDNEIYGTITIDKRDHNLIFCFYGKELTKNSFVQNESLSNKID